MVLVNNKRKKRAMSKGNGGDSGFKKMPGLGRSLYRPYNLNFLPGLGACCKPDGKEDPDKAFKEAVARYNTLVVRITEMKQAHDATTNDDDNVKENVDAFQQINYTRTDLTVKDMEGADVVVAGTGGATITKANLRTLVNGDTVLSNQNLIDFNTALKAYNPVRDADKFKDDLPAEIPA